MPSSPKDLGPDPLPELPEQVEDRLNEILLDHAGSERGDLIDALLAEHPECREPVLTRVAAMTQGDRALDLARSPLVEAPLPERIGEYRIHELLGEGGFGTVYRAEQQAPVHRIVALKVLHPRRLDERSQWRFQAERQTLARMQHANIAQIYDAGQTPEGLLYFAMEFVDGEPITAWCDRHELPLDARLHLFLQVCAAVHHAHQRGVVHRDLKPSNVLVQTGDNQPEPKVIDFGIAKVLEGEDGGSLATRDGALIGTPGYMSPEQAAGDPIDTRSDVYALGVLLYELLTGDLPFARERLLGSVADVAKIVREENPRRLGTALREASDVSARVAANRGRSVAGLTRELRSDLEWIVRHALEKNPDQRYSSVSDLIADVVRYRNRQPVAARQPEAFYLARRFVGRHRVGVATSLALVAATIIALVTLLWLLDEVDTARRTAVEGTGAAVLNEYSAHLAAARAAIQSGNAANARHHLQAAAPRHRGWEWHYLTSLCDTSLCTIPSVPEGQLASVAWLDGDRVCQIYDDGRVFECDADDGSVDRELPNLGWNYKRHCFDRTRDRLFAITDEHGTVVAIDTSSWELTTLHHSRPPQREGRRDTRLDLRSLVLAPDQRTLAISDNLGNITLLDTYSARPPRVLCTMTRSDPDVFEFAWAMRFTPDGEELVIASGQGYLDVYTTEDGILRASYRLAAEGVRALALDADSNGALVSVGRKLCRIDLTTGRLLQRIDVGHELTDLFWSNDRRVLYGVGQPGSGRLVAWDADTLELAGRYHGHRQPARGFDVHPTDGRIASTSQSTVRIWSAKPPVPFKQLPAGFHSNDLGVSADGNAFGTVNRDGIVRVWNARTCELELEAQCEGRLYGCALTADTVYVGGAALLAIDRATGARREGEHPGHVISRMCIDPEGRWLVAGSFPHGKICIWSLPNLELQHRGELPVLDRIVFDESRGSFLLTGTAEALYWLDPTNGSVESEPHEGLGPFALAAREGVLGAGSDHLLVRYRGTAGFQPIGTATGVTAVAFSSDLDRIITATDDSNVTLWNRNGNELLILDEAPKMITELAFVAGDTRLIGLSQLPGAECFVMVWGPDLR